MTWHHIGPHRIYFEERCLAGPVGPRDLDYLAACGPAPASAAQREAILRALPEQGAVTTLTSKERAKVETLGSVLRLHAREDVYDVKVIDVPQAGLWIHGRAVLLISLPALRLLKAEQLQALVAHEIGHEYWWDVWEAARRRDDHVRLRSLEGQCDAVATLTLIALGIPAERLSSALGAVHHFNRRRFRIPRNGNYPTLRERREIVKRFSTADGRPLGSLPTLDQEAQASHFATNRPASPSTRRWTSVLVMTVSLSAGPHPRAIPTRAPRGR